MVRCHNEPNIGNYSYNIEGLVLTQQLVKADMAGVVFGVIEIYTKAIAG